MASPNGKEVAATTSRKRSPKRVDKAGAARLKALREQMGWSPEALGAKANVSGVWIRWVEAEGHEPSYTVKARLAKPFGMLPYDIWAPKRTPLSPADISRLRELTTA